MNRTDRAILIGMILGDGCLKKKSRDYVEFSMSHCEAQLPYLEYKRDLLHSIFGGKLPNINTRHYGKYTEHRVSKQHSYFKLLRKWIYPEGSKRITRSLLDKLDAHALALWYQDDGTMSINLNKEGNISSFELRICCHVSKEEAEDIVGYFGDVWGIASKARLEKKTGKYTIRFNTTNGKLFIGVIKPYIQHCMRYKIDITTNTRARNAHMYG